MTQFFKNGGIVGKIHFAKTLLNPNGDSINPDFPKVGLHLTVRINCPYLYSSALTSNKLTYSFEVSGP